MIGLDRNTKIDPEAATGQPASLEVFSRNGMIAVKITDTKTNQSVGVSFSSPETVQHIISVLQRAMTEVFGHAPVKPG